MPKRIDKDTILTPGTVDQILKELDKLVAGARERLTQIKTESKGILDQFGQPIAITGENINKLNQASTAVKKLATEQKTLTAAEQQAERIKKQLNAELAKQSAANVRAAASLKTQKDATRQLIIEQQKLTGTFKTGFFTNLINQVKTLAAAYLGLYAAGRLVGSIFSTTKELNVLSQSFKYLIQDADKLANAQGFLADITKRYGLELVSTSQSFLKFQASIAGSNFDLKEAQKIFESVSKAGSVLGLNVQRMELVFLALEQMISKGTVSTEELRRQLGDNLPGAMRIMADALGVTIPELLKMIKANQVLASDALPKFAVQLEKAYGIESVKTISNLQTAVNNLKNTWTLFIQSLKASDEFMAILGALAKVLGSLSGEANINGMKVFSDQLDKVKNDIKGFVDVGDVDLAFKSLSSNFDQSLNQLGKYRKELAFLEGEVNKFIYNPLKTGLSEKEAKQRIKDLKEYVKGFESLVKELDTTLGDGDWMERLFPKVPKGGAVDQDLIDLQNKLAAAKGLINKLEAQKNLNEYLKKQATDTATITKLNLENEAIDHQIALYNELGAIVTKYTKIKAPSNKGLLKMQTEAFNEAFDEIEKRNQQIIDDRTRFYESIGLLDESFFKNELQFLKEAYDDNLITEDQYLLQRARSWMSNNQKLIEAVDAFAQSFNALLTEINQGQIDAAQSELDIQDDKLDKLKSGLDKEKALKDEGKANNYDRTLQEIAEQQQLRDKANEQLARAKKREAQIQLAGQASDIITASANIIEGWSEINPVAGVLIGLAQVGALITAFVSYKNKINAISKYGEGEIDLDGKPHSQGGRIVEVEGHESIIKGSATKQSKRLLTEINEGRITDLDLYRLNFSTDLSKSNYQKFDSAGAMLAEMKKTRIANEEMLKVYKDTPAMKELSDGRIMLQWGKHITKIVTLNK